ncbi:hypothetical protein VTL71DRAFT_7009 [Oculimacula yallundae]|uniref:DUF2415 domain-containing protein n=1 Tax=Oculimacula yallundae TaxID=86028 RepID=A0ABR4BVI6_9HELO
MAAMAAVKEESLYHATEALILPTSRKYYRVTIDTSHWQLRSLISSPQQGLIYFPNGTDIVCVNTKTRERELIAELTFLPRCLVASKDWLCCGGDNGKYTAISLKDRSRSAASSLLDNDGILHSRPEDNPNVPFSYTTHVARLFTSYQRRQVRESTTHNEKIGPEIVNCITLWSPSVGLSERAYKVPVAVVSNNDCTITILNVATSETLQKLKLPDFVNRTVISPDGELLVSVCDDPFLYIHKRLPKSEEKKDQHTNKDSKTYEWVLEGRIQLKSQRQADRSQMRGSFALSFSASGKYLAVATQYGIISVFDAECLTAANSLVVTFTSSRPGRQEGAIRAMEFNPGPFDLLAWTEASGRVGVADVRNLFNSRQLILVNSSQQDAERITLSDINLTDRPDPTPSLLRNPRTESPPSSTPYTDYEIRQERRRLALELMNRDVEPLTTAELNVLEASRVARQQRDAANAINEVFAEASATSRRGPWAEGRRPITASPNPPVSRLVSNSGLPTSLRDVVDRDRRAASFRTAVITRMNNTNRESLRRSQILQTDPRRHALIQPDAENSIERDPISFTAPIDADPLLIIAPADDTPSAPDLDRLTLGTARPEPEPFVGTGTVRDYYRPPFPARNRLAARQVPADIPVSRSARVPVEIGFDDGEETVGVNPREFAHRLRQPWRPTDEGTAFGIGNLSRDENGSLDNVLRASETMGCCWSPNGRILYAATLEGIHEYHVNITGRRMFPSIVFR